MYNIKEFTNLFLENHTLSIHTRSVFIAFKNVQHRAIRYTQLINHNNTLHGPYSNSPSIECFTLYNHTKYSTPNSCILLLRGARNKKPNGIITDNYQLINVIITQLTYEYWSNNITCTRNNSTNGHMVEYSHINNSSILTSEHISR